LEIDGFQAVSPDRKHIRMHANDVQYLSQLLTPDSRIEVAQDLLGFLDGIESDHAINLRSFGIDCSVAE
jgi:hypothetical protein